MTAKEKSFEEFTMDHLSDWNDYRVEVLINTLSHLTKDRCTLIEREDLSEEELDEIITPFYELYRSNLDKIMGSVTSWKEE